MDGITVFRKLLAGDHPAEGYDWRTLMTALDELCAEHDEEAEQVLRGLLEFDGDLPFHEASDFPHSMSPEDYLTSHAIQVLAQWNREHHREAIAKAAEETDSELLQQVAKHHLERE